MNTDKTGQLHFLICVHLWLMWFYCLTAIVVVTGGSGLLMLLICTNTVIVLLGGTESGILTLICHNPTSPGARPEYCMSASATKALLMMTRGLMSVSMAPCAGSPSGGAPAINPWPVPYSEMNLPREIGEAGGLGPFRVPSSL